MIASASSCRRAHSRLRSASSGKARYFVDRSLRAKLRIIVKGAPRRAVRTQAQLGHRHSGLIIESSSRAGTPPECRGASCRCSNARSPVRHARGRSRRWRLPASNATEAGARRQGWRFPKKRGLAVEDNGEEPWVYRKWGTTRRARARDSPDSSELRFGALTWRGRSFKGLLGPPSGGTQPSAAARLKPAYAPATTGSFR